MFQDSSKGVHVRLKGVSRVLDRSSTSASGKFQWWFRVFQESFQEVSTKLQEFLRKIQDYFKKS